MVFSWNLVDRIGMADLALSSHGAAPSRPGSAASAAAVSPVRRRFRRRRRSLRSGVTAGVSADGRSRTLASRCRCRRRSRARQEHDQPPRTRSRATVSIAQPSPAPAMMPPMKSVDMRKALPIAVGSGAAVSGRAFRSVPRRPDFSRDVVPDASSLAESSTSSGAPRSCLRARPAIRHRHGENRSEPTRKAVARPPLKSRAHSFRSPRVSRMWLPPLKSMITLCFRACDEWMPRLAQLPAVIARSAANGAQRPRVRGVAASASPWFASLRSQ